MLTLSAVQSACSSPEGRSGSVFSCCSSPATPWCLDSKAFMTHGRLFNHPCAEAVNWFLLISTLSPLRNDLFSFALWINWLPVFHCVFLWIFMAAGACSSLGAAAELNDFLPPLWSLTSLSDYFSWINKLQLPWIFFCRVKKRITEKLIAMASELRKRLKLEGYKSVCCPWSLKIKNIYTSDYLSIVKSLSLLFYIYHVILQFNAIKYIIILLCHLGGWGLR